jgi:hypothetical protein
MFKAKSGIPATCNECSKKRRCVLPPGISPQDFTCSHGRDPTKSLWCHQTQPAWIAGRKSVTSVPRIREVECSHCGTRRVVPDGVDDKDLFLDWNCSIRTWCMNPLQQGYQEFNNCNKGKTNKRLIKAYLAELAKESAQNTEALLEPLGPTHNSQDFAIDVVEDPVNQPAKKKQKKDVVLNPTPEGTMRRRMRDLLDMVGYVAYVPGWYVAHIARGKWQAREIARAKATLFEKEEKIALFTIDMKSKTVTGKNREQQGHGMGARGMSLQGCMLHYVKYEQTSNQHLEEAMTGLAAQLAFIRSTNPKLETIWIISDKCSNFNSFNQILFIVAGNERNWGTEARPFTRSRDQRWFRAEKWLFTEAQLGKDDLDCHFSFVRRCFEQFLQIPKKNMTKPAHMYDALKHPTLLGNTKHDALKKKFYYQR